MDSPSDELPVVKRRERQDALEHRRQILGAAKRLFAAQGVDQTSMFEIARAAGVGQGTLYRRFSHKGELCAALLHEDVEAFKSRVSAALASERDAAAMARLDYLIAEKIRITEQHMPLLAAIEAVATTPRRSEPYSMPFYGWLRSHLVSLLTEGIARGEIAALDVEFTSDAILSMTAPPLIRHYLRDRGYSVEQVIGSVRRIVVLCASLV